MVESNLTVSTIEGLGINYLRCVNFLRNDCKIGIGYEAQTVGLGIESAATSALVMNTLAILGESEEQDVESFKHEVMKLARYEPDGSIGFGSKQSNSWATSQVALAAIKFNFDDQILTRILRCLVKFQLPNGEWTFSCSEDPGIIFAVYPTLALVNANRKYGISCEHLISKTAEALANIGYKTESERLLSYGLLAIVDEFNGQCLEPPHGNIDFYKIIKKEFWSTVLNIYTTSTFSLNVFSPSLYLMARQYISFDHPFALYCIKWLMVSHNFHAGSWPLIDKRISKPNRSSFSTALAMYTIYRWAVDLPTDEIKKVRNILYNSTLEQLEFAVKNVSKKTSLFVSYSSKDVTKAKKLTDRLTSLGFDVTFAEYDLLVGDSIPGFINDGLQRMDYFLMCLSPAAVASKYVKDELDGAKATEWLREKKVILPVMFEPCSVPTIIHAKKYADFREDFETGLGNLLKALK